MPEHLSEDSVQNRKYLQEFHRQNRFRHLFMKFFGRRNLVEIRKLFSDPASCTKKQERIQEI